ncbi:MAG: SDR family oxidoreductase [Acidobacteriaceae bacterium]|nr:SDR family oxidoreductase [Acidobacteriaceae bacterium]
MKAGSEIFSEREYSGTSSKSLPLWQKVGLSAAAMIAVARIVGKAARTKVSLAGKVVLITGSRGLGLALAYEFGRHGALLALCARDEEELRRACDGLQAENIEAAYFLCDLTKESEIRALIEQVLQRFGKIDILINNAGAIQVGPIASIEHSDFREAMDLMFWAPVNLTFAVLPEMKRQGGGHIINITSIGGRVSVPHLLPYSCAKFAFVAFSTGLAAELRSSKVHVLTAVPGLMRTGSYLNAKFKGDARQEFAWFGLLGNIPGFSVAASYAAACIRKALERERYVCTISLPAKLLIACEALLPETTRMMIAAANRFLMPDGESKQSVEGHSLDRTFGRSFHAFTALGQRAAHALNEKTL